MLRVKRHQLGRNKNLIHPVNVFREHQITCQVIYPLANSGETTKLPRLLLNATNVRIAFNETKWIDGRKHAS